MFTRRQLTAALGLVGVSLVGGTVLLSRRGLALSDPTPTTAAHQTPTLSDASLATVVEFIGALFGHALTAEDRVELLERLHSAIGFEPDFASDYAVLIDYSQRYAREAGAASFVAASEAQRHAVLDRFMSIRPDAFLPRVMARFFISARLYYEIRWKTIPALAMLYRRSGLPWRARGYRRWPGVPGSWAEYLAPGPAYPDVRLAGKSDG